MNQLKCNMQKYVSDLINDFCWLRIRSTCRFYDFLARENFGSDLDWSLALKPGINWPRKIFECFFFLLLDFCCKNKS